MRRVGWYVGVLGIIIATGSRAMSLHGAAPIRVMILDGESGGPYHRWQVATSVLEKELSETGLFDVEVVTAPPAAGDFTNFKPDFSKYRVVVFNYDAPDERWPASLKASFEEYMQNGGGLVERARGRQCVPELEGVQRNERRRRLAQQERAGRPDVVLQGWQARSRFNAR